MSTTESPPSSKTDPAHTWAMACHLGGLLGFTGIPFGNVIGPLIFWLIKKEEFPFVNDQGKEAVNFQITVLIGVVIGLVLIPVLGLGILVLFAVGLASLILLIIGAVAASKGESYRYPVCIRFIK